MLPDIRDWLTDSWGDYRRRWGALMAVLAAGGLATAFGALAPLVPAAILSVAGVGSPVAVWSVAAAASLTIGLWLSSWAQAAALLAASTDLDAASALSTGWRKAFPFAWVLTLATLAIGGGFVLLIVPGLLLGALLVFAPFYQLAGEAEGADALALSCARVRPHFGAVSLRLFVAWLAVAVPSWIPWIGWLIAMFWTPFGFVACGRLAADLRTLGPAPERPRAFGAAVAGLAAVLIVALGLGNYYAARAARELYRSYASGGLTLKTPDPAAAQALIGALQNGGGELDALRAVGSLIQVSTAAPAAPAEPGK